MKKRLIRISVMCVALSVFCTSCATPYVWNHTDPKALNRMPNNSATEDHIRRHELKYAPDNDPDYLLVENTKGEKATKTVLRIVGTPVAVIFDTALVCLIALGGAAAANPDLFTSSTPSAYSYTPPQLYAPSSLYTPPHLYSPPSLASSPPALIPVPSSGQTTTYRTVGNTTYGSDGSSFRRIGDAYYGSDGTSWRMIGNTLHGSDGLSLRQIGNTCYGSDGTSYRTTGNTTYGSDGSTIRKIGDSYYLHK